VDFVAGVNAFGAVAYEEVFVHLFTGNAFEHRHAIFFGSSGVNSAFIDHDVAILEDLANRFGGLHQRGEVGAVVFVGGCGHGDDVYLAVSDGGDVDCYV